MAGEKVAAALAKPTTELSHSELLSAQAAHEEVPESPTRQLAFVGEPTLRSLTNPAALNSGNLHDIYVKRKDDFEEPELLEVQYSDGRGGTLREIIFVDPVYAEQRPRICVSIEGVQAMHRAIGVLSRKVDNLVHTLRDCRAAYYHELLSLREQVFQVSFHQSQGKEYKASAATYFDPTQFDTSITEEVLDRKLKDATADLRSKLQLSKDEAQRLEKQLKLYQRDGAIDDPRSRVDRLLETMDLAKVMDMIRAACGRANAEDFYAQMDRIMREYKLERGQDDDSEQGLKQELEAAKKQVQHLLSLDSEQKARIAHHAAEIDTLKRTLVEERKQLNKELAGDADKIEAEKAEAESLREQLATIQNEFKDFRVEAEKNQANVQENLDETVRQLAAKDQALKRHVVAKRIAEAGSGKRIENYSPEELVATLADKMNKKELVSIASDLSSLMDEDDKVLLTTGIATQLEPQYRTNVIREVFKVGTTQGMEDEIANRVKEDGAERMVRKLVPKMGMHVKRAEIVEAMMKHAEEEETTRFAQNLPEFARKAVVVDSLNALATSAASRDSDSEDSEAEEHQKGKVIFDPANDLTKKARRAILQRLFKRLPANEVKQIASNMGQKAREALFKSVLEDQTPEDLRRGVSVLSSRESLRAIADGLTDDAVSELMPMIKERTEHVEEKNAQKTRGDDEQVVRSPRGNRRLGGGVGVQTEIAGVGTPLVQERRQHDSFKSPKTPQTSHPTGLSEDLDVPPSPAGKMRVPSSDGDTPGKKTASPVSPFGKRRAQKKRSSRRPSELSTAEIELLEETQVGHVGTPKSPHTRPPSSPHTGRSSFLKPVPLDDHIHVADPKMEGTGDHAEPNRPGSVASATRKRKQSIRLTTPSPIASQAGLKELLSSASDGTHELRDLGVQTSPKTPHTPRKVLKTGRTQGAITAVLAGDSEDDETLFDRMLRNDQAHEITLQESEVQTTIMVDEHRLTFAVEDAEEAFEQKVLLELAHMSLYLLKTLDKNGVLKRSAKSMDQLAFAIDRTKALIDEHASLCQHIDDLEKQDAYVEQITENVPSFSQEALDAAAEHTRAVFQHGESSRQAVKAAKAYHKAMPLPAASVKNIATARESEAQVQASYAQEKFIAQQQSATASYQQVVAQHGGDSVEAIAASQIYAHTLSQAQQDVAAATYHQAAAQHGSDSVEAKVASQMYAQAVAAADQDSAAVNYQDAVAHHGSDSAEAKAAEQAYVQKVAQVQQESVAAMYHHVVAQHGQESPEAKLASQAYSQAVALVEQENAAASLQQTIAAHGDDSAEAQEASRAYSQAMAIAEAETAALLYAQSVAQHGQDSAEAQEVSQQFVKASLSSPRRQQVQNLAQVAVAKSIEAASDFQHAIQEKGGLSSEVSAASIEYAKKLSQAAGVSVDELTSSVREAQSLTEDVSSLPPEVLAAAAAFSQATEDPELMSDEVKAASTIFEKAIKEDGKISAEALAASAKFAQAMEQQAHLPPPVVAASKSVVKGRCGHKTPGTAGSSATDSSLQSEATPEAARRDHPIKPMTPDLALLSALPGPTTVLDIAKKQLRASGIPMTSQQLQQLQQNHQVQQMKPPDIWPQELPLPMQQIQSMQSVHSSPLIQQMPDMLRTVPSPQMQSQSQVPRVLQQMPQNASVAPVVPLLHQMPQKFLPQTVLRRGTLNLPSNPVVLPIPSHIQQMPQVQTSDTPHARGAEPAQEAPPTHRRALRPGSCGLGKPGTEVDSVDAKASTKRMTVKEYAVAMAKRLSEVPKYEESEDSTTYGRTVTRDLLMAKAEEMAEIEEETEEHDEVGPEVYLQMLSEQSGIPKKEVFEAIGDVVARAAVGENKEQESLPKDDTESFPGTDAHGRPLPVPLNACPVCGDTVMSDSVACRKCGARRSSSDSMPETNSATEDHVVQDHRNGTVLSSPRAFTKLRSGLRQAGADPARNSEYGGTGHVGQVGPIEWAEPLPEPPAVPPPVAPRYPKSARELSARNLSHYGTQDDVHNPYHDQRAGHSRAVSKGQPRLGMPDSNANTNVDSGRRSADPGRRSASKGSNYRRGSARNSHIDLSFLTSNKDKDWNAELSAMTGLAKGALELARDSDDSSGLDVGSDEQSDRFDSKEKRRSSKPRAHSKEGRLPTDAKRQHTADGAKDPTRTTDYGFATTADRVLQVASNIDPLTTKKLRKQVAKQINSEAFSQVRSSLVEDMGEDERHKLESNVAAAALQSFMAISEFLQENGEELGPNVEHLLENAQTKVMQSAVQNALKMYSAVGPDGKQKMAAMTLAPSQVKPKKAQRQMELLGEPPARAANAEEWLNFFQGKRSFDGSVDAGHVGVAGTRLLRNKLKPLRGGANAIVFEGHVAAPDEARKREHTRGALHAQRHTALPRFTDLDLSLGTELQISSSSVAKGHTTRQASLMAKKKILPFTFDPSLATTDEETISPRPPQPVDPTKPSIAKTTAASRWALAADQVLDGVQGPGTGSLSAPSGIKERRKRELRKLPALSQLTAEKVIAAGKSVKAGEEVKLMIDQKISGAIQNQQEANMANVRRTLAGTSERPATHSSGTGSRSGSRESGGNDDQDHLHIAGLGNKSRDSNPAKVPNMLSAANLQKGEQTFDGDHVPTQVQSARDRGLITGIGFGQDDLRGSLTERDYKPKSGIAGVIVAAMRTRGEAKQLVGPLVRRVREKLEEHYGSLAAAWVCIESTSEGDLTLGGLQKGMVQAGITPDDAGHFLQAVMETTSGTAAASIPGDRAPTRVDFIGAMVPGRLPQKALDQANHRSVSGSAWWSEGAISSNFRISEVQDGVSSRDANTILTSRQSLKQSLQ